MADISPTWITEFSKYKSSNVSTFWFSFDDRYKDLSKPNSQYQEFIVNSLVHINNALYGSVPKKDRHTFENFEKFTKKYLDIIAFPIYHFIMNIENDFIFKRIISTSIIKPILRLKGSGNNWLDTCTSTKTQYAILGLLHISDLYRFIENSPNKLVNIKKDNDNLLDVINNCFLHPAIVEQKNNLICSITPKYHYFYLKGIPKKYIDMVLKDHCFVIIAGSDYCKSVLYYNTLIENKSCEKEIEENVGSN